MHYQCSLFDTPSADPVTLLPLYCYGRVVAYTQVDTADAAWAAQWCWHYYGGGGYAMRAMQVDGHRRTIFLHRELLGLPLQRDGREGDHRNRDPLDNRRANLRIVTHQQNSQNQSNRRRSRFGPRTSQYRGVYWHQRSRLWQASGKLPGARRSTHLGAYRTEEDAARAAACWRATHMPLSIENPALLAEPPPSRLGTPRGERNAAARLTADQVRVIRARYATGDITFVTLARAYGVTPRTVRLLVLRQTWAHVD